MNLFEELAAGKAIGDNLRGIEKEAFVLRCNLGVLLQQPDCQRPDYKRRMLTNLDMLAIRIENLKDQVKEIP